MSIFRSSALRLMPPQHRERAGKWTHEPRSNLYHKKHLSNAFTHSFIFSIILFRKYKNIFSFLHTQPRSKNTITASYLFYCICYDIPFYLHLYLVLDNHSVELGTQDKEIVLQVACRRMSGAFSTVPREFDIKPRVLSWGKFTLAITLSTWSPDELEPLLSVIKTIFWRHCWGTKESIHNCYLHRVKTILRRKISFIGRTIIEAWWGNTIASLLALLDLQRNSLFLVFVILFFAYIHKIKKK
jgi:hypothetical protein